MFVTLRQGPGKSVTGTDGPYAVVPDGSLLINNIAPEVRILQGDQKIGAYGGLLYNCAPRETVGSVVFSLASPFRTVERADSNSQGPVLGVIVAKYRDTVCEVVQMGAAPVFRNLRAGVRYFLGPRGTLVSPPLDALKYVHYVGIGVYPDTLMVCATYPLIKRDV